MTDREAEDPVVNARAGAEAGVCGWAFWVVPGASPWAGDGDGDEEEEGGALRAGGPDPPSFLAEPPGSAPFLCTLPPPFWGEVTLTSLRGSPGGQRVCCLAIW